MTKLLHLPSLIPANRNLAILFCCLLLMCSVPLAGADTTVGGTISTDTTWTLSASPYIVTSNITVKGTDGADSITTLTIEPGVVVKLNSNRSMNIGASSGDPGALVAQGTSSDPVVFTSNQASPAPGDWYYIRFLNTTDDATTLMEHCEVEYGGYSSGSLYAYQASPTLRNVTIASSKAYGAYLYSSAPTIENCTFSGNQNYDLYYTGTVGGSVTGSTLNSGISLLATGTVGFSGNTINQNNAFPIKAYADSIGAISASSFANVDAASYMEVNGGTVSRDATWTAAMPYAVTSNITVKGTDGADGITTLTLTPGAMLKMNQSRRMDIGASSGDPGALIAQGTSSEPVVFTSNQASPAPGDWYYIRFQNTTDDATTILEHCVVEYAGYSSGSLYVYQASPTLRNVTIANSKTYGAYLYSSAPAIENCTFSGNQNYDLYYTGTVGGSVTGSTLNSGLSLLATGTVDFSGNTINQNNTFPIKAYADSIGAISASSFANVDAASYMEVNGGTVNHDATWSAAMPYTITNNITVKGTDGADGITTLALTPGAILKMNQSRTMDIGASSGDPGALVAQGTSENQILFTSNQASPAPGDWYYIRFQNTTDDATTILEHCVVEYGGYSGGTLYLYNAAPRIQNNTIRFGKTAGLYIMGSGSTAATINCNTFSGNKYGVQTSVSPPPELHNNNFIGNTTYGLYYTGSQNLNAEDNWWNDAAGPNAAGDTTYGNVDADPWSSEENDCTGAVENQPPNVPTNPAPADTTVRVSTDSGVTLTWTGGDPNPLDLVSYDVYWGTAPDSLQPAATDLNQTTFTKDPVDQGLTFYWQIIARDDKDAETQGPVWSFTTNGDPPDLIVSQVSTDPAGNLQSGQSLTFTADVQNNGSGPAVDAFTVDFKVDGVSIGTATVEQILLAGELASVSQIWTYNGGDPTIEVTTDSQGQVSETDETNNTFNTSLLSIADNSAPVLVGSSPADGAQVQQILQIEVTLSDSQGIVDDAAVIASISVTDDSSQPVTGTTTEADDTFTFVPGSLPLPDGAYQVSLVAADTYGNSQNHAFSFVIDTQPPTKPTITGGTVDSGTIAPQPAQNSSSKFIVELTGTREDGTSVWINGAENVHSGQGDWSVELTLAPGSNDLEIWLKDPAGNQGESEWVDIEAQISDPVVYQYDANGRTSRISGN